MKAPAITWLIASLGVPFWLGWCFTAAIDRHRLLSRGERLGLAYPCGAILLTLAMCGISLAGLHFNRATTFSVAGAAAVLAWLVARRRKSRTPSAGPEELVTSWPLRAFLAALLLSKVAFVLVEVLRRPLVAWDSFAVWSLRAKVWAVRASLVLDPQDPFYLGSGARLDYPPHVSLLQSWTAICLGDWNDVLVNVPWAAYYVSAIVFLYGTTVVREGSFVALAAAYCLAGLPLLVVHASIAGYAELMLGVHFLIAVSMIHQWAVQRHAVHLILGSLFTLALPYTKLDGIPLAAACLVVMAMQAERVRRRNVRILVVTGTMGAALTALWLNDELRAYLASSRPYPEAIGPFVKAIFASGSWNLLWVFFFVVAALRIRFWWGRPLGWLFANVALPMAGLLYLFFFTSAARFAVQGSADSRLLLELAPAALYFVVLATAEALRADRPRRADDESSVASLA